MPGKHRLDSVFSDEFKFNLTMENDVREADSLAIPEILDAGISSRQADQNGEDPTPMDEEGGVSSIGRAPHRDDLGLSEKAVANGVSWGGHADELDDDHGHDHPGHRELPGRIYTHGGHLFPEEGQETTGDTATGANNTQPGTLTELADFLTRGYWNSSYGDGTRAHNVTSSGVDANNGVLHYNVSGWSNDADGITEERAFLVREAFKLFEATLGIQFVETTSQDTGFVDFFFQDTDGGAYAGSSYTTSGTWGSTLLYSYINVSPTWSGGTSTYNDYTLQTILHEIGHALGLGHQGPYNGGASYGVDNDFANDSWQASMMSYFSQTENTYVSASYELLQTPMSVDWLALDELYGRQGYSVSNAFAEDTVWGFNTTITSEVSDIWAQWSSYANVSASTIIDGGGIDTLDLSGYSNNTLINLAPSDAGSTSPSTSDIGGRIGNLTMGVGTIIENAIGGSGSETFYGNAADNSFVGNGGDDTFHDSAGSDTYNGGAGTDTVVFGANFVDYAVELVGGVLQIIGAAIDWVQDTVEWLEFVDQTLSWQAVADTSSPNTAPGASDDAFSVAEGVVLSSGNLLANDTDADGDALSVASVNGVAVVAGGTQITLSSGALVTVRADGTFDYDQNGAFDTLNDGEQGTDSFTYVASDSRDVSGAATVTITINGVTGNTAPTAVADTAVAGEDLPLAGIAVLNNDADPDGDALTITAIDGQAVVAGGSVILSSGATVTLNADGTLDYAQNGAFDGLNDGETGTEVFSYTISDGTATDTANVTVTINGETDPAAPVAADDSNTLSEAETASGNVLANDTDINGDPLSVTAVNGDTAGVGTQIMLASGALLTLNADGTYTYDPNGSFDDLTTGQTATDSFSYTVSDGVGGFDTATVTLTIDGETGPVAPVAGDDSNSLFEDGTATGNVLTNDTDENGDALTVTAVNGSGAAVGAQIMLASGALLTLNADGSYSYDPNGAFDSLNDGQNATDSFTYTVSDGNGGFDTATVTLTINGITPPPVAEAVLIDFEAMGTGAYPGQYGLDFDGLTLVSSGLLGGAAAGYSGTDGTFSITATGEDFDLNALTLIAGSGRVKLQVLAYDDGVLVGSTQLNVSARSPVDVVFDTTFDSVDQIVFSGNGDFYVDDIALVTRTVVDPDANQMPVALDDAASTTEIDTVTGNLLANDSDPDGDLLTLESVGGDTSGSVTLVSGAIVTFAPDGSFIYDPNGAFDSLYAGQSATDSFSYVVSDGQGGTATAMATMTIAGVGDAPTPIVLDFETSLTNGDLTVTGATLTTSDPGVASGSQAATSIGNSLTVESLSGDTFDFEGGVITVAGKGRSEVTIEGYDDGVLVATEIFNLRAGREEAVTMSNIFDVIDTVVISAAGGVTVDDLSFMA